MRMFFGDRGKAERVYGEGKAGGAKELKSDLRDVLSFRRFFVFVFFFRPNFFFFVLNDVFNFEVKETVNKSVSKEIYLFFF